MQWLKQLWRTRKHGLDVPSTERSPVGRAAESLARFCHANPFEHRVAMAGVAVALVSLCASPTRSSLLLVAGALALLVLGLVLRRAGLNGRWLSTRLHPGFAVLVITTLVLLLSCEIVLRVFFSHLFPNQDWIARWVNGLGYRYDQTLGWCPIPNSHLVVNGDTTFSVSHNSRGFRDAEPVMDSRPRIVFLGDSMVWGFGVEAAERFTDKLSARHPGWGVFNFGVSGYGTDQEYLLLQRYFSQYRPQVVFLVYCTSNDDGDNLSNGRSEYYYKPYFVLEQNTLRVRGVPVPRSERVFHHHHPLLSKSCLLCLALRAWNNVLHLPLPRHPSPTFALITTLRQYVEAQGATFYMGLTGSDPELEAFLRRSQIRYVDLSTDLVLPDRVHWSPEGQTYVAAKIEKFLAGKFPKPGSPAGS